MGGSPEQKMSRAKEPKMDEILPLLGYSKDHPSRPADMLYNELNIFYFGYIEKGNQISPSMKLNSSIAACAYCFLSDNNRVSKFWPENFEGFLTWPADKDEITQLVSLWFARKSLSRSVCETQRRTRAKKAKNQQDTTPQNKKRARTKGHNEESLSAERVKKRARRPSQQVLHEMEGITAPTTMKEWLDPAKEPDARTCIARIHYLDPRDDPPPSAELTPAWLQRRSPEWPEALDRPLERWMHNKRFYITFDQGIQIPPEIGVILREGTEIEGISGLQIKKFLDRIKERIQVLTQMLVKAPYYILEIRRDGEAKQTRRFDSKWRTKEVFWEIAAEEQREGMKNLRQEISACENFNFDSVENALTNPVSPHCLGNSAIALDTSQLVLIAGDALGSVKSPTCPDLGRNMSEDPICDRYTTPEVPESPQDHGGKSPSIVPNGRLVTNSPSISNGNAENSETDSRSRHPLPTPSASPTGTTRKRLEPSEPERSPSSVERQAENQREWPTYLKHELVFEDGEFGSVVGNIKEWFTDNSIDPEAPEEPEMWTSRESSIIRSWQTVLDLQSQRCAVTAGTVANTNSTDSPEVISIQSEKPFVISISSSPEPPPPKLSKIVTLKYRHEQAPALSPTQLRPEVDSETPDKGVEETCETSLTDRMDTASPITHSSPLLSAPTSIRAAPDSPPVRRDGSYSHIPNPESFSSGRSELLTPELQETAQPSAPEPGQPPTTSHEMTLFTPPSAKTLKFIFQNASLECIDENLQPLSVLTDNTPSAFFELYSQVSGIPLVDVVALKFTALFGESESCVARRYAGVGNWKMVRNLIATWFRQAQRNDPLETDFHVMVSRA